MQVVNWRRKKKTFSRLKQQILQLGLLFRHRAQEKTGRRKYYVLKIWDVLAHVPCLKDGDAMHLVAVNATEFQSIELSFSKSSNIHHIWRYKIDMQAPAYRQLNCKKALYPERKMKNKEKNAWTCAATKERRSFIFRVQSR